MLMTIVYWALISFAATPCLTYLFFGLSNE